MYNNTNLTQYPLHFDLHLNIELLMYYFCYYINNFKFTLHIGAYMIIDCA